MKSPLLLLLLICITAIFQFARASDEPKFFAARGSYAVSPEITLVVSNDPETKFPKYMLNYKSGGGNGQEISTAKPADPFLIYWDRGTQTLWWATSVRVGYCDVSKRSSARSSSHDRAKAFHDYDKFPPRPVVFLTEMERTLPAQP